MVSCLNKSIGRMLQPLGKGALFKAALLNAPLLQDRRGVVAVVVGLSGPVLLMSAGIGFELSNWSVTQVELQRIADAASLAGTMNYNTQSSPSKQTAAQAAANVAVLNGIKGVSSGTSPTWNSSTNTLTDGNVTVAYVTGVRTSSDTTVTVTVKQAVPLYLAGLFMVATSRTMTASATSEIISTSGGGKSCLVALKGSDDDDNTSIDITVNNGASISAPGCVVRSDGRASFSGGATINANVVAGGSVTVNNGAGFGSGYNYTANAGQIGDPLANNSTLQTQLTNATGSASTAANCTAGGSTCRLSPGTYSSMTINNGTTAYLAPGTYVITGSVSCGGGANVYMPSAGVTIIANQSITIANGVNLQTKDYGSNAAATNTIYAPTDSSHGGIPGVVFATNSNSTTAVNLGGGASFGFDGVMYAPKGGVSIANGVKNSTSGCSEIVGQTISLAGGANFDSDGCKGSYGLNDFPTSNKLVATLVQ